MGIQGEARSGRGPPIGGSDSEEPKFTRIATFIKVPPRHHPRTKEVGTPEIGSAAVLDLIRKGRVRDLTPLHELEAAVLRHAAPPARATRSDPGGCRPRRPGTRPGRRLAPASARAGRGAGAGRAGAGRRLGPEGDAEPARGERAPLPGTRLP